MDIKDIIGPYALVFRENTPDVPTTLAWYESKLGFVHDPRYDAPPGTGTFWAQLKIPKFRHASVGLSQGDVGVGTSVLTFVVPEIESARQRLIDNGVTVEEIKDAGQGVLLAFFDDDAKNRLCLRQNPPHHPQEFV